MADKKYVQKGLFRKIVGVDGSKPNLPEIYSFQSEKGGFYLKRAGSIITPKLVAVYEKDGLPENNFVGETTEGMFVRFDVSTGEVSQKYVEALREGKETIVVTTENEIVSLNKRLAFERTGYTYVSRLGNITDDSKFIPSIERSLSTPYCIVKKGSQYGVMSKGEIICPAEFYTKNLSLTEENGFTLVKSSDKQLLLHRTSKILLAGQDIYAVMDYSKYHSFEESRYGQVPYYASYDKNTDTSTLFGFDWADTNDFIELGAVPGRVKEVFNFDKNWIFNVETEKRGSELVSLDGDIRVAGTDVRRHYIATNIPHAELVLFDNEEKIGVLDLNTKQVAVPAKFSFVKAVVQDELGNYRAIVRNANNKYGIVDQNGNSLVHQKYEFVRIEQIPFGKDGATHFVAKFAYTTTAGTQYIYVDPESENGLASELAIRRYRVAIGELKSTAKEEEFE